MDGHRFDLLVTWALLAFGVWYGVQMLGYPDDAGVVPAIAAAIMIAALVVQLVVLHRKRLRDAAGGTGGATALGAEPAPSVPGSAGHAGAPGAVGTVGPASGAGATVPTDDLAAVRHAVEEQELEQDSYENLIALRGVRRRRFLAIAAFSVAFYVGYLLVGFVVTTGVLMAAILVAARERPHVVVIGALVGAGAAYALVVSLLGIPAMSGYLVP
jgi:hypothetical protein